MTTTKKGTVATTSVAAAHRLVEPYLAYVHECIGGRRPGGNVICAALAFVVTKCARQRGWTAEQFAENVRIYHEEDGCYDDEPPRCSLCNCSWLNNQRWIKYDGEWMRTIAITGKPFQEEDGNWAVNMASGPTMPVVNRGIVEDARTWRDYAIVLGDAGLDGIIFVDGEQVDALAICDVCAGDGLPEKEIIKATWEIVRRVRFEATPFDEDDDEDGTVATVSAAVPTAAPAPSVAVSPVSTPAPTTQPAPTSPQRQQSSAIATNSDDDSDDNEKDMMESIAAAIAMDAGVPVGSSTVFKPVSERAGFELVDARTVRHQQERQAVHAPKREHRRTRSKHARAERKPAPEAFRQRAG